MAVEVGLAVAAVADDRGVAVVGERLVGVRVAAGGGAVVAGRFRVVAPACNAWKKIGGRVR